MKYRFLILFIFFLTLFLIPLDSQAGCCQCLPAIYGGHGLEAECVNNQNFPDQNFCNFYCNETITNYHPLQGYPIFSNFCDENTGCPLDKKSCCIKVNTYDEKIESCTSNVTQAQCTVPVTKYIDGKTCEEINCANGIGKVLSSFLKTEYTEPEPEKPFEFVPQVTIPGSIDVGEKTFTVNQGQGITVDGSLLSKYIAILFNWLIGAIGVVTVAYLAFGGLQWLGAAGNASGINKAKETIRDALIGMLLVAGSYTILYIINPGLVRFIPLEVTNIEAIALEADGVEPEGGYPQGTYSSGNKCTAEDEVITPPAISGVTVTASDKRLKQTTIDKLTTAAQIAQGQGYSLKVTSMFRTYAHQEYLYNCYKNCNCNSCNPAAKPDCRTAPHMNGIAIDVCIVTSDINTCNYVSQKYNGGNNAGANSTKLATAQKKLQEIMKQAGFNRLCKEWWHFEAVNWTTNICQPGIY